jgi:hypothetical protein
MFQGRAQPLSHSPVNRLILSSIVLSANFVIGCSNPSNARLQFSHVPQLLIDRYIHMYVVAGEVRTSTEAEQENSVQGTAIPTGATIVSQSRQ